MFKRIIAMIVSLIAAMSGMFGSVFDVNNYSFGVDTSVTGEKIGNKVSNVNVWQMGTMFYDAENNPENDIFDFVEYVQLMQCSGGNEQRDLFVDPYDRTVLDDYDFTSLIENCNGILKLGAKPHLKLGNVPLKYSSDPVIGGFDVNVCPPDDYDVYYNYIAALAQALVDAFGREEVLTWRFGVMTEYENGDWFLVPGDKSKTAEEFIKLYDHTVAALCDVIGDDVYVGAHSMTVTEGDWDEEIFIKHCAEGINTATGEKGTRICYLSASFYDSRPGKFTSGKTLPQTIAYLRATAEKYGLYDLSYGIDEGRILQGVTSGKDSYELLSRTVGYTWQASYDARLYKQMIDNDIDYFSSWGYLSNGLLSGIPTVSYYVAENVAKFNGSDKADVGLNKKGLIPGADINATAAFNSDTGTLRIMAYNFKNDLKYKRTADLSFDINVPQLEDGKAEVVCYMIDDNCNYFDDWCSDKKANKIGNDEFGWSPDDGNLGSMKGEKAKQLFSDNYEKYEECAKLVPTVTTADIVNSKLHLNVTLAPGAVVFFEITNAL